MKKKCLILGGSNMVRVNSLSKGLLDSFNYSLAQYERVYKKEMSRGGGR